MHEKRTFYFSRRLNFLQITKDTTLQVDATDHIEHLRQEIGVQHPWERIEPPNSLSREYLKPSLLLDAVQRVNNFYLFSDPKGVVKAFPQLKLKWQSIESLSRGDGTLKIREKRESFPEKSFF